MTVGQFFVVFGSGSIFGSLAMALTILVEDYWSGKKRRETAQQKLDDIFEKTGIDLETINKNAYERINRHLKEIFNDREESEAGEELGQAGDIPGRSEGTRSPGTEGRPVEEKVQEGR